MCTCLLKWLRTHTHAKAKAERLVTNKLARNAKDKAEAERVIRKKATAVHDSSACLFGGVHKDLLSEVADVEVVARELKEKTTTKVAARVEDAEPMLRAAISTAETTREWAPLDACAETVVAGEVLSESCADAVEDAEDLLVILF